MSLSKSAVLNFLTKTVLRRDWYATLRKQGDDHESYTINICLSTSFYTHFSFKTTLKKLFQMGCLSAVHSRTFLTMETFHVLHTNPRFSSSAIAVVSVRLPFVDNRNKFRFAKREKTD